MFDTRILTEVNLGGLGEIPMLQGAEIMTSQFILGPEGSGSPPHFHTDALNAAVVGKSLRPSPGTSVCEATSSSYGVALVS